MSGVWSRLFETRHRMSADEIEAEALGLVANRGLRTSYVRNERGSLRNLIEQTEYLSDRRCEKIKSEGCGPAASIIFSSRARLRTSGLSTPAMWMLGRARFSASANEPPIKPVPYTVTFNSVKT